MLLFKNGLELWTSARARVAAAVRQLLTYHSLLSSFSLPSRHSCHTPTHQQTHTYMFGLCLCVCNLQRVCVISGQQQKQSQQQRTPSHASCLVGWWCRLMANATQRERERRVLHASRISRRCRCLRRRVANIALDTRLSLAL